MIDISLLCELDFETFNRVVNRFEEARRAGQQDAFDIDAELRGVGDPELAQGIRDEIRYIDSYFSSQEIMIAGGRKRFGAFEVEEHVGTGGFGVVFRARDPEGNFVAVKVAHFTTLIGRPKFEIEQEAKILQELAHENIVGYIDSGWTDTGDWYIATEWVEGKTLAKLIETFDYGIDEALVTMVAVAKGIAWGHDQGIIHRDIKPRNIMMTEIGDTVCVKILDYGVSKYSASEMTRTTNIRGSRNYMAPEQFTGVSDERSDVYSMGRVMCELLRKRYPDVHDLPWKIREIVNRATKDDPAQRYQTAAEFRDEVGKTYLLRDAGKIPDHDVRIVTRRRAIAVSLAAAAAVVAYRFRPLPAPTFDPTGPVASYFNSKGEARVVLTSSPPTAEIYAYPINILQEPSKDDEIFVGIGNASAWLEPNDYLVVTVWPDGTFHEVLRRVPRNDQTDCFGQFATEFCRSKNGLSLRPVEQPPQEIASRGLFGTGALVPSCNELEGKGMRHPFLSEITTSDNEIWTLNKTAVITIPTKSGRPIYARYFDVIGPNGDKRSLGEFTRSCGYQGFRSLAPFGRTIYVD